MAALEAEQQREEAALLAGTPAQPSTTAASTPPNPADGGVNSLSAIGSGIKSMPASRRPSGGNKDDLAYHLSKLAVSPGSNTLGVAGAGARASLDGSATKPNGNEPFSPGFAGKFVFDDDDTSAPGESLGTRPQRVLSRLKRPVADSTFS